MSEQEDELRVYRVGSQIFVDGQPAGYICDGNSEDGYGLMIAGKRWVCDGFDAVTGFALARRP